MKRLFDVHVVTTLLRNQRKNKVKEISSDYHGIQIRTERRKLNVLRFSLTQLNYIT